MPGDIRADTDLTIATPSRSCVPHFALAMRDQRPTQLFEFVQNEASSSKLSDIWRRKIKDTTTLLLHGLED